MTRLGRCSPEQYAAAAVQERPVLLEHHLYVLMMFKQSGELCTKCKIGSLVSVNHFRTEMMTEQGEA